MFRSVAKSLLVAAAGALHLVRCALRCPHPKFVSIEPVLSNGTSIIRWGDGETNLLLMRSISFQRASPRLALELGRILLRREKRYVVCVPPHLRRYRELVTDPRYRSLWARTIVLWELLSWRIGGLVSDAYAFRNEGESRPAVLKTVMSECNVRCVVSKDPKDAQTISTLVSHPVLHVQCPAGDAYEQYGHLRQGLLAALVQVERPGTYSSLRTQKVGVLVSAGPAGKVLISELASTVEYGNVQFVDVGHFFDHGVPM
jgi:hypothetical protein